MLACSHMQAESKTFCEKEKLSKGGCTSRPSCLIGVKIAFAMISYGDVQWSYNQRVGLWDIIIENCCRMIDSYSRWWKGDENDDQNDSFCALLHLRKLEEVERRKCCCHCKLIYWRICYSCDGLNFVTTFPLRPLVVFLCLIRVPKVVLTLHVVFSNEGRVSIVVMGRS